MQEDLREWSIYFCWRAYPNSQIKGFSVKDDEIFANRAIKFLVNCAAKPQIIQDIKSTSESERYLKMGKEKARYTSWESLLEIYTQALLCAPSNSPILARAYGKCSSALYKGQKYNETLFCIERALAIGYPDGLKSKLYARRARCYFSLNNGVMCNKVREAIVDARKWIGQMADTENNKKYLIGMLNVFPVDSPDSEPMTCDNNQMSLSIPDDNLKIVRASDAVELKYSQEHGRHVVATRDIQSGEILLAHKSYASIIHPDMFDRYCLYCSKSILAGVPCNQCSTALFCNETCRDLAWDEHHDIECLVIPAMVHENMSTVELTCLRLVVKAYKEAGTLENLKAKLIQIEEIDDPIARTLYGNMFDNTKYESVYSLSRRYPLMFTHTLRSSIITLLLAAKSDIFNRRATDYQALLKIKLGGFVSGLILRHLGICFKSGIGELRRDNSQVTRLQINPFLSMCNHSCDPPILVHTSGNMKIVIAIKDMKAGEQIYSCYLPDYWNISVNARKKFLKDSFDITCECRACKEKWKRYRRTESPSFQPQVYSLAVVDQWNRIINEYPGDNDLFCSNVSMYMKFYA